MSRAAVLTLLRDDTQLAALGGTGFVVEPNFNGDQRPNDAGAFIVIRWGSTDFDLAIQDNAAHHFDLWIHIPVAVSTDYVRIDDMIDRCDSIFAPVADTSVAGADGWTLTCVEQEGRSRDLTDDGYMTICRRASYKAFSCKT